jgi:hypothetical protein
MDSAPTEETKCVGCRHPFCPVANRDLRRKTAADLQFWKKKQDENECGSGIERNRKNTNQFLRVVEGQAHEKPVAEEPKS